MSWKHTTKKLSLNISLCERCHINHGLNFRLQEHCGGYYKAISSISFSCAKKHSTYDFSTLDQRDIPPSFCDYFIQHFASCREMLERKGRIKKKLKTVCIAPDVCKSCRKNSPCLWNADDETLWKEYRYIRCQLLTEKDYDLVDGLVSPPSKCPYALEHMVLSKKNLVSFSS